MKVKFGKYSNYSAFKAVEKSGIKTLIILGKQDMVAPKFNYKFNSKQVKVISLDGKGHNPYNTIEAERYLNQTLYNLNQTKDLLKTLAEVDYDLITQEDELVLQLMLDFYKL